MRIIKTALAVTATVYLAMWLNLDSPFFAAMAALITMQGNLLDSFSMAKYRMLGTVLGAAIGILAAYLAHGNPILIGFGIALIIFVCNKLRWNKAIAIATIVFASLMLGGEEVSYIYDSLHRVLDTTVGIAVAVIVNFTISRPQSRDRVINSTTDFIKECKTLLGKLICQECGYSLSEISEQLEIIERELPGLKTEVKMHIVSSDQDLNFDVIKAQIDELYQNMFLLAEMEGEHKLNEKNVKVINEMYGVELAPEVSLEESDIVFNYHLGIALRLINKMTDTFNITETQGVHKPARSRN